MTLQQYTNLLVANKIDTLNSLYKGLVKFDKDNIQEGQFDDLMKNMGMS